MGNKGENNVEVWDLLGWESGDVTEETNVR